MFQRLGHWAATYRWYILAAWIVVAVVLGASAPNLDDVSTADQKDFLPDNVPFAQAQEIYERAFPEEFAPGSTMVLVDAREGGSVRTEEPWAFIEELDAWLASDDAPDNIKQVLSPAASPEYADRLISSDNRIAMVSIDLTTPLAVPPTTEAVETIDDWLETHEPETFDVYQTGEAALDVQADESTFKTMDRTIIITFALVIIALLAIYRSPVSPLIPLFAVTMAFIVTVSLVAVLADNGVIKAIAQVQPILVVVMYGAGTDYCLFLISRFREEMADDVETETATRHTVHMVGETITSSAATVVVGFTSMIFAEMGVFQNAGPMLALGIVISLLAGLTLVPALLSILGNRAFWPGKARHRATGRFYEMTSKQVSSRPLTTILIIVAIMLPFSIYGLTRDLNYDTLSELPEGVPSVKAYNILRDTMGAGESFPLTMLAAGRDPATMAAEISRLGDALRQIDGVVDVYSLNNPLGYQKDQYNNMLRVDGQLSLLLAMDEGGDDAGEVDTQAAASLIMGMQGYVDMLAERFPEVAETEDFQTVQAIVGGGLPAMMTQQAELLQAVEVVVAQFESIDDAYMMPPTGEGEMFAVLKPLVDSYIAEGGTTYRLRVVLDDPLAEASMDTVEQARETLAEFTGDDGEAGVTGFTAVITDLRDTMERDEARAFAFILAGIFVVLLFMLRSVVAPLYLIGTVVLSFTCTLGITNIFFDVAYGRDKLSWMLPLFMFVFLVALGIDYSIFLFGRIKEEVGYHGIREGVHIAVARTGAIITSAGIILAGTFAGMMTGEIAFLVQLGFAVAVGVLIDTFVVRTVLDPALATLFGRWTWFPGGVPKARIPERAGTAQPPVVEPGD